MSETRVTDEIIDLQPPEVQRTRAFMLGEVNRQPPSVGIFDSPTRCYVINKEWAEHVMGMVHLLADVVSWRDAEDESYFAIQEVLRFMQGMECMDFSLRQDPTDDCILQQTLDGGTTWTDVFNFSLCSAIGSSGNVSNQNTFTTSFTNIFQNTYNEFTTNYVDSPDDVHPELDYSTSDPDDLDAAYCNALYTLVNACCDAAIQYYRDKDESQQDINVGLAIGVVILTAIALAGALPTAGASLAGLGALAGAWATVIGLTAPLGNALVDEWQARTIDQFQDTAAREEVVCYILEHLHGDDNTLATMQAVLDSHTLTGNAAAIADTLDIFLSHDSTYAAFLEKWANNLEYAEAGIELYCPCEDPFEPVISNEPCTVAVEDVGSVDGEQSPSVWRISSTHYAAANGEAAVIADIQGRSFRITNAVKVSGSDIFSWTYADAACDTFNGFGGGFVGQTVVNVILVTANANVWTYDLTVVLA